MKKCIALLMALLLACPCFACHAEDSLRTNASYHYALQNDGGEYVENLIFNEDVIVSGENTQIIFSNCEFNGDIILTADEGTRVLLLGCDVNGTCVVRSSVREASFDYNNPKFLTDRPVSLVCEDCVGSLVTLGDFEVTFNGQAYSMADSQFFIVPGQTETTLVPYEGQTASYCVVAQWYENDQKTVMVVCEYDPET